VSDTSNDYLQHEGIISKTIKTVQHSQYIQIQHLFPNHYHIFTIHVSTEYNNTK